MKRIYILAMLFIIGIIGFGLFYAEGSLPAQPTVKTKQNFVIAKGDSVNKIINNLEKQGFIRNRLVFFIIVKQLDIENKIQAGLFRISPSMRAKDVALTLTHGSDDVWVTVIEGLRKEEIAQILSDDVGIPESEFIKRAQEGTLFPDTYLIPRDATIDQVLNTFASNFNKKYSDTLRSQARAQGLSDSDVLILASIVEREANSFQTMKQVASILRKRLKEGYPLQVDATVQYALGYQEEENSWWKKSLSLEDLKISSFYNTYTRTGLPPGSIGSPGLSAITAVIESDTNTPYLYYISNKDGSQLHYARTLDEHNENIRKYLR